MGFNVSWMCEQQCAISKAVKVEEKWYIFWWDGNDLIVIHQMNPLTTTNMKQPDTFETSYKPGLHMS